MTGIRLPKSLAARSIVATGLIAFGLAFAGAAQAQDAKLLQQGKDLYTNKGCVACHGADAKTPIQPEFPKLAGQFADYLFAQMADIRNGVRTGDGVAPMKPIMDELTSDQLEAIAIWLYSLPR